MVTNLTTGMAPLTFYLNGELNASKSSSSLHLAVS